MCKCGPVYSGGLYETTAVWTNFSIAEVQQKREDPSACNFIFQRVHLTSLRARPVRKVMDMFHSWISRRFHCLIVLGSLRLDPRWAGKPLPTMVDSILVLKHVWTV